VALGSLGFATAVAQAVLLREGMAALGGSELAWGTVLALWLAGMGAGSWAGTRWSGPRLVPAGPAFVLVLSGLAVVLVRAAPALAGASAGETATAWRGLWVCAIAGTAPAVAGGWCFPAMTAAIGGASSAGTAYALESTGAVLGGLAFTFALAPLGAAATLCVAAGACAAAGLLGRRSLWIVAVPVLVALVAAAPAARALAEAAWRWSGRLGALADWKETRLQRLELASGAPAAIYADGRLAGSYPDPYGTVPRAHLVLLLHPHPGSVLVVGGAADGSFVTMLRHPVARLVVAEEDAALAAALPRWLGPSAAGALADPRLTIASGDPLRVARRGAPWDLIVLADDDPTTLRHDRTRTVEFVRACAVSLAPGGVLVMRVGVGDTYLGGVGGRLVAVLAATLKQVFPDVTAVPGEEILLVASRGGEPVRLDPGTIASRWRQRRIEDPGFDPSLLTLQVDASRAAPLDRFIRAVRSPDNTTRRPRAVLLAAALREGRGAPLILAGAGALERSSPVPFAALVVAAVATLLVLAARGVAIGLPCGAVVGFTSMGWWLLLLACWQATMGSVYGEIGALSAAFMGGSAVGALLSRRWPHAGARALAVLVAAGAALSLAIATGLPVAYPRAVLLPLLVLAGGLTGAAFPVVAGLVGGGAVQRGAGRGFAADEVGAAAAALLVGLVVFPSAGLTGAAAGMAALGAGTAGSLIMAARRRPG
jgi:spermidine synthase